MRIKGNNSHQINSDEQEDVMNNIHHINSPASARIIFSFDNNSHASFISAYAPTMAYSDQAKEESYEQLDHAIQSVPHSDKLFLLGDFNARVGSDHTT